ncbi:hypothetical protein HYDPIDRAFT_104196 [Hydnomerulius pinastri MD-312]|uniref:Uncharacterized protein n=1 Tax=Hydnomerulius pinastri MD-312 TaxID=994086 RepID=A0A0C2L7B0_9AGAM|nr:hypothetical protein HYDPIDRAFT_104196 [Hydnomerulius pinastri MD-312]
MQPAPGFLHLKTGISKLPQVIGRAQRDIKRCIVTHTAGEDLPPFVRAVRALMDFQYLCQALIIITDVMLQKIVDRLKEFHDKK